MQFLHADNEDSDQTAQADLSLRWTHMSEGVFSHVAVIWCKEESEMRGEGGSFRLRKKEQVYLGGGGGGGGCVAGGGGRGRGVGCGERARQISFMTGSGLKHFK